MPRPKLRERLASAAPQGREALFESPPPASAGDRTKSTVDGQPATAISRTQRHEEPRWEEAHQRVTFYCPRDLLDAIEREGARSDRSKTRVIVDAVRQHLAAAR